MSVSQILSDFRFIDVVDILVVAAMLYALAKGAIRTNTPFVLTGILILTAVFSVARLTGLKLVSFLFQGFFTVVLVALVVIFQEELKRFLEQIGGQGIRRRQGRRAVTSVHPEVETIVKTVADLAKERVGALLVLEGNDSLLRHVHGGTTLEGNLSEPLLRSIFDPSSIGHDGAVLVVGNRVTRFSCQLPLSTQTDSLLGRGTRHAAALGLAERTDALCLVVSEERGTISVARNGHLTPVTDLTRLTQLLEGFVKQHARNSGRERPAKSRRDFLLKLGALAVAAALWFFFVHESKVEYRSFGVPVEPAGLPPHLRIEKIEPSTLNVVVSGPRRAFYFVDAQSFRLTANLLEATAGRQLVTVKVSDLQIPTGLNFVNLLPRTVTFVISASR